jgi:hypothetical protein
MNTTIPLNSIPTARKTGAGQENATVLVQLTVATPRVRPPAAG